MVILISKKYGSKRIGLGSSSATKGFPASKIKRELYLLRHKDKTGDDTVK